MTKRSSPRKSAARKSPVRATAGKKATAKEPARKSSPPRDALARLRRVCLAFPEAHEVEAWGEPTFRVRNKLFAMHSSSGTHHGAGRPAVWIAATRVSQD